MIPSQTIVNLQQALKLALSMTLLYWIALSLDWDLPKYGALAIALIHLDTTGASLDKGLLRIIGTTAGLGVGLLGLALFAQDAWPMLVYHASFLAWVGYKMQASRYPYAWFVAGFLPSLVWATTYGKIENTFSYATFRYLETTAGVVIYTLVSMILWPRKAGDSLGSQGHDWVRQLRQLFAIYRGQLDDQTSPADVAEKRAKLAGTGAKLTAKLQAAYADTPSVADQKATWEEFRIVGRAISDSIELWRQSIGDCCHLDIDRLLPRLSQELDLLDQRFSRIDRLWQERCEGKESDDTRDGDRSLLNCPTLHLNRDAVAGLSHLDRAALLSLVQQLDLLHRTSSQLLQITRVLSGLDPAGKFDSHALPADLHEPLRWDAARLVRGMLPAFSFLAAWVFWIHFNPPTGPSIPNMAATFGLLVVMTPINALMLIPLALIVMGAFVAPTYFLVMPRLSTGPELLSLVFVFAFASSTLLVGRLAPLRTLTLVLFVMMTGISNDQSYSFVAMVDGALMILLAVGIVSIVQTLIDPAKPERALLSAVRRFFRGCAEVTRSYETDRSTNRVADGRFRQRCLQSMVLPGPAKVRAAHGHLDAGLYPDNTPESVQRLIDAMQGIGNRMQAVEIAHQRLRAHGTQLPPLLTSVTRGLAEFLQSAFDRCAQLETIDEPADQQPDIRQYKIALNQQFDQLNSTQPEVQIDDRLLTDVYALFGTVRGLVEAVGNAQVAVNSINWKQWATPRF